MTYSPEQQAIINRIQREIEDRYVGKVLDTPSMRQQIQADFDQRVKAEVGPPMPQYTLLVHFGPESGPMTPHEIFLARLKGGLNSHYRSA